MVFVSLTPLSMITLSPSIFLQMALFYSFLWLSDIFLYISTTSCPFDDIILSSGNPADVITSIKAEKQVRSSTALELLGHFIDLKICVTGYIIH